MPVRQTHRRGRGHLTIDESLEELAGVEAQRQEPSHGDAPLTPEAMRSVLGASLGIDPDELVAVSAEALDTAIARLNELVRRLSDQAARDELTGVLRRGSGFSAAQAEISRARRGDGRLVLAVIDVDGLKQVNDTHGHLIGDRLLRTVGQTLQECLRAYDIVIRFGGDEFVCLLTGLTCEQALDRLALVSSEVAARADGATLSVGCTDLREGDSLDDLIARADDELYTRRREVRGRRQAG